MKCSLKNLLICILMLTVSVFFLFSCATKKESTQPLGTAEPPKPVSEPPAKTQEVTSPPLKTQETIPPPAPEEPTTTPSPPSSPLTETPEASQAPAERTTEIVLAFVNFRQGPSMDSEIISVLKKGTELTILEEKAGWLNVKLEDGTEGWVGKAMTSEATQPEGDSTEIILGHVNFRQGPSMDSEIISVLKKGTKLTVLEEKAGWLHVKLEDGTEGWVGKAMTSMGARRKSP